MSQPSRTGADDRLLIEPSRSQREIMKLGLRRGAWVGGGAAPAGWM